METENGVRFGQTSPSAVDKLYKATPCKIFMGKFMFEVSVTVGTVESKLQTARPDLSHRDTKIFRARCSDSTALKPLPFCGHPKDISALVFMFAWIWRNLWPFSWPGSRVQEDAEVDEPEHPLLLIPGICGTQLAIKDKGADHEDLATRVWDREYKKLWGRVNSSEYLELLDSSKEVCVPKKEPVKDGVGEDGGLYPIDILDPSLYVPLHVVYYFHNLIWYLTQHKYKAGKTLFGFGYDFRQSNMSHMDDLVARLEAASAANNGAKVDVVTHSMGGLVMRSLLALRPRDYSRLVRKWIAIACPFGGAPGFGMDALMTGVEFCQGWEQYFFVGRSTMHAMCCQAPAVYELLPDPQRTSIWPMERGPPKCTVYHRTHAAPDCIESASGHKGEKDEHKDSSEWPTGSGIEAAGYRPDGSGVKEEDYGISEFRNILGAALKGYTVTTNDNKQEVLDMDPILWEISDRARAAWRTTVVPRGSQFFNIFGTGFQTAYDVEYGAPHAPVEKPGDIASGTPVRTFSWIDGDYTVPLCCSVADGLDAVERKGFFATHRGLLELPQVWEAVLDFVDIPVEDSAAGTAESSAETFPMSHSISPVLGTRPAAKVPGASQHNTARTRRHAQLRTEAHARSKEHRQAWTNGATVCPQDVRGAAARSSEEGWVFVKKPGVKGVAQVKLPRVSTESRTEETINPLREHIETKQL